MTKDILIILLGLIIAGLLIAVVAVILTGLKGVF